MTWSRRDLFTGRWLAETLQPPPESPDRGVVHWLDRGPRARVERVLPSVAKVMPFNCLNLLGGFCATCVERCPQPGAIRIEGRKPVVDAEVCDGCGRCAELCPAPGGALVIVPEGT